MLDAANELDDVGDFLKYIEANRFDHIDFGCSKGGSLAFAKKRFSGERGLGMDIVNAKVEATRKAGFDAICYDINKVPDDKLVRFVIMSHFLEHVSSPTDVMAFIKKACVISRDFVYIQQPYFDADGYLFQKGFKLFWSDWTGHPNRMTSLELNLVLRDLRAAGLSMTYSIHAHHKIADSFDPAIHALGSAKDQHGFDSDVHPGKGDVMPFDDNVFSEIICLITFPGTNHDKLLKCLRYDRTLYDSRTVNEVLPSASRQVQQSVPSGMWFQRAKKLLRHLVRRAV